MRKRLLIICTLFISVAQAQIPSYLPLTGLKAWYPFNGTTVDNTGGGNNATNMLATYTTDRAGNANAAMHFNGSSSGLSVASPSFTWSYTGAFSYSWWVNKQTQPLAGIVLMTGTNTANNFITLIQGASNTTFGTTSQQQAWVYISCAHALNQWDHYVVTYDNTAMKLYRNGTLQTTGTFTYTGVNSANLPFYVGRGINGGYFAGDIDDIAVWNRALTATEITNIYFNSISTTGVSETQSPEFAVYPNPSSDYITISSVKDGEYSIADVEGKVIGKGIFTDKMKVDISAFQPGIYFIYYNNDRNTAVRFVKE